MRKLLLLGLLLAGLTTCSTKAPEPQPESFMSAQVNGLAWQSDEHVWPVTNVTDDQGYTPMRYVFYIKGDTHKGLPGLKLPRFTITLATNYLPKIGRHLINGPGGPLNPKGNYYQAIIWFDAPDGGTYNASANAGFLNITEATTTHVAGTFELTAPTLGAAATSGAPAVFTVTNGAFYGDFGGVHDLSGNIIPITWDGEQ